MCGIVGIYRHQAASSDQMQRDLRRMAATLQHRGPDGAGYILADGGRIGLAQTRLSIVDLSGGQQPLCNETGDIFLVANGEIYDAEHWRQELERKGHHFETKSDSEIILHLYEELGADCLKQLNGEYAFLLWDGRKKQLLAGRDVFGIKPLFFMQDKGATYFASELKALLAMDAIPRRLNPEFFTGTLLGSLTIGPTPFVGLQTIRPGHYLRLVGDSPPEHILSYRPSFQTQGHMDFEEARRQCASLLRQAVERRLVADVPVHVYMSGGLDSTSIAALMKSLGHRPTAFSVSFPDSEMDESAVVRKTAAALDLDLDILPCSMDLLAENLEATLWATEAPIGNLNSVAKFLLARHVHERGVKVCLTGEGADELFAGYAFWKQEAILQMQSGSEEERERGQKLWQELIANEKRNEGVLWHRSGQRKGVKSPAYYGFPSYYRSHAKRMDQVVPRLFRDSFRQGVAQLPSQMMAEAFPREAYESWHPLNVTRAMALAALHNYIIPLLGDRVEMAHSLECRTPFMDRDLLRFVETVPPAYLLKIDQMREKHLLYEAMKDLLPQHIYEGKKHPFLSPSWSRFAKTRQGRDLLAGYLKPKDLEASGVFSPMTVRIMKTFWQLLPVDSPRRKSLDLGIGIVLSSQILHKLFISNKVPEQPLPSFRQRLGKEWKTD